uniref:Uncharacterized protein n=1 Tax=Rhizophora mucronata TaxID=61149 RepID=A0A2P2P9D6_RHIMU
MNVNTCQESIWMSEFSFCDSKLLKEILIQCFC